MNKSDATPKPLKILFVDNSRNTRAIMTSILSGEGYTVVSVGTGNEAINKLKSEHFDMAILDLYMPIMNGYELAKVIRDLPDPCKNVPLIALTASQDPKDIALCKSVGMNEYVIKAEDHTDLFEAIERYRPPSEGPSKKPSI